jgi:hypothetical protein
LKLRPQSFQAYSRIAQLSLQTKTAVTASSESGQASPPLPSSYSQNFATIRKTKLPDTLTTTVGVVSLKTIIYTVAQHVRGDEIEIGYELDDQSSSP